MADLGQTAARLRRTFQYPAEDSDSDDSQPEAIDEQEQEDLINALAAQNTARNAEFRLVLLALPLVTAVPYLSALFSSSSSSSTPDGGKAPASMVVVILGLTSLLSTAFLLYKLPPTSTGIKLLDAWSRGDQLPRLQRPRGGVIGTMNAPSLDQVLGKSPLETYLPYMNIALAVLLAITGWAGRAGPRLLPGVDLGTLPALVYGLILTAKTIMGSVDPERELSKLTYQYKGA